MSITDELRKWISTVVWLDDDVSHTHEKVLAIADRIDAAHERELRETGEDIVWDVRHEWIRLPVDADNVPVHIGDVMEFTYDPPQDQPMFEVSGFGANGTLFYAARGEVVPRKTTNASVVRHHHEPTVEDVLREFADIVRKERVELATISDDTIAEYAARLRLAGDAE